MTAHRWTGGASSRTGLLQHTSTWRVTTAVRTFGLAIVLGQMLSSGGSSRLAGPLVGCCLVAVVACVAELQVSHARLPWLVAGEGLMVGLLVGLAAPSAQPIDLYLAIPAVVAGVNGGRFGTVNAWLATGLALVITGCVGDEALTSSPATAALWLSVGLGAGMLAAHQSRALRRAESAHAPYAAAHRLVGQLHTLLRDQPGLLDVVTQASLIRDAAERLTGAHRAVVFLQGPDGLEPVSARGPIDDADHETGSLCTFFGTRLEHGGSTGLPLRVGHHVIGAVVIAGHATSSSEQIDSLQAKLDEDAIRLETGLLVEEVRGLATVEERNRMARDIHDGVAQRVVALGYLVDEVAAASEHPLARSAAEELRGELTRLVSELRFSVYNLRHDVEQAGGLSAALSDYVRELGAHSRLRVHLTLDEQDPHLSQRTQSELLRIAQEALGNVHRHARAVNVWVRLRVCGRQIQLVVEDDGIGGAGPRAGHYGLHTMRERAARIDAELHIGTRHDGGTSVTVASRVASDEEKGAHHDQRLARR